MEARLRRALILVSGLSSGLTLAGTVVMVSLGFSDTLRTLGRHLAPGILPALVTAVVLGAVLAGAGAFALAWWLARALARALTARLSPFVAFSRRIAAGDLHGRLPVLESDELGELAWALNTMAGELQMADRRRETFLAAVAHDLRTPLAVLQANLEGMMTGVLAPDPERFAGLSREVNRLIRLVEDLLTLASARAGALAIARRPQDLAALTRAVVERFEPLASARGVALVPAVPPSATGSVDPDRIDEVLTNLVSNAIRHVPPGGHVKVSLALEGAIAQWTVADDGPGIPASLLAHVTEPFVRGDSERGRQAGSGLGLAIADTWVRAHGGKLVITVDSGTRASVRVPIAPPWPA